jgi:hypothetical protein
MAQEEEQVRKDDGTAEGAKESGQSGQAGGQGRTYTIAGYNWTLPGLIVAVVVLVVVLGLIIWGISSLFGMITGRSDQPQAAPTAALMATAVPGAEGAQPTAPAGQGVAPADAASAGNQPIGQGIGYDAFPTAVQETWGVQNYRPMALADTRVGLFLPVGGAEAWLRMGSEAPFKVQAVEGGVKVNDGTPLGPSDQPVTLAGSVKATIENHGAGYALIFERFVTDSNVAVQLVPGGPGQRILSSEPAGAYQYEIWATGGTGYQITVHQSSNELRDTNNPDYTFTFEEGMDVTQRGLVLSGSRTTYSGLMGNAVGGDEPAIWWHIPTAKDSLESGQ